MEPVELNIIMRNQTREGLNEIAADLEKTGTVANNMVDAFIVRITVLKAIIQQAIGDIKQLEGQLADATPNEGNAAFIQGLGTARRALEEDKAVLAEAEQSVRAYGQAQKDAGKEAEKLSESHATLKGSISVLKGLSGAFDALQGVSSLAVGENEKLAEIQAKLQTAMKITAGLQKLQNTLSETSAFNTQIVSKATSAWTAAQTLLNTKLGLSVGLSKALMVGGIGILIAGITALVLTYKKLKQEQEEAEKINKLASEGFKRAAQSASESSAKQIASLDLLYKASQDQSRSMQEREAAVNELQKVYPNYFGNISKEAILNGDAKASYDELTKSILASAKARALEGLLADNFAEQAKVAMKLAEAKENEKKTSNAAFEAQEKWNLAQQNTLGGGKVAAEAQMSSAFAKHKKASELVSDLTKQVEDYDKISQKIISSINVSDLLKDLGSSEEPSGGGTNNQNRISDAKKIADELLNLQKANEQEYIQQLQNEGERVRAQIEQNYKTRIAEIEKQEQAWRDAQEGKLTTGQTAALTDARGLAASKRDNDTAAQAKKEADAEKQILADIEQSRINYLKKYGDHQERRLAIMQEYAEKMAKAANPFEEESLANEMGDELKKIDAEILHNTAGWANLFADASQKSVLEIKKMRDGVKALIDYLKGADIKGIELPFGLTKEQVKNIDKKEVEVLEKQFNSFNQTLSGKSDTTGYFNRISEGVAKIKKGIKDLEEADTDGKKASAIADIGAGISSTSQAIGSMTGSLKQFGSDLSVIFNSPKIGEFTNGLADMLGSVMKLGDGVGKLLQGDIVGGITGITSGVADWFKNSRKVNAEHKEALRLLKLQDEQMEHMYRLSQLRLQLENAIGKTIFGTDKYGNVREAVKVYKIVLEEMAKALEKLNNVEIVTGSKTSGWTFWKKRKDVYESLSSAFPDVIEDGKLNKERAQIILSTKKMSEDDKKALQEAINYAEVLEKALSEMTNYLTDIFGDLGKSMSDALVDAFRNGSDAAQAFTDSVSSMLDKLAQDMIYSVTLAPLLEIAQTEFLNILQDTDLSDTEKFKKYTETLTTLSKDALGKQGEFNSLLKEWEAIAAEQGLSLNNVEDTTSQSGKSGAMATVSQDSFNRVEGIITAIQMHIAPIDTNVSDIAASMYKSLDLLAQVVENTTYCRYLEGVKEGIDKIIRDGIKTV